jgi:type 1 glutamine amidotransferase
VSRVLSRSARVVTAFALALLFVSLIAGHAQQTAGAGNQAGVPIPAETDVQAMLAALPSTAPARPARARSVLVLADSPGFRHTSIPLAARMVEELGRKTGAWITTVSYDPIVITSENLKQYDAIVLDSTVGAFLDEVGDQAATAARRAAFLEFVRGGKGLVGIHAATDTYHSGMGNTPFTRAPSAPSSSRGGGAGAGRGGRGAETVGRGSAPAGGTWPEFNQMIGGIFKNHPWQRVAVKIDDPESPLTSMFTTRSFEFQDETYSFFMDSWSRKNLHVLMSIDYAKMSDIDKALESNASARTDGDYGLSWIRRDGAGRVFYLALGHREDGIYRSPEMLRHVLAGIQYAIGDLKADDRPSVR